jgi:hypothetical protein
MFKRPHLRNFQLQGIGRVAWILLLWSCMETRFDDFGSLGPEQLRLETFLERIGSLGPLYLRILSHL